MYVCIFYTNCPNNINFARAEACVQEKSYQKQPGNEKSAYYHYSFKQNIYFKQHDS